MTDAPDRVPPPPIPRRRSGRPAVAVLAAVPTAVVLVALLGPLRTDFAYQYSGLAYDAEARLVGGQSTIDGNAGVTSQALGTRAALDVLGGHLPLWNHFEGLGAPLLGEMQAAALFPPTWLMALPHGQAIAQALLQFVAGLGAFLFFRRFGLGVPASLAGGLAFEVNGVFAWLRNAIADPAALLPWLFFAVEGLRAEAATGDRRRRGGAVALGAVAAALALYAGFPEEVYLYGILLIAWTLFRAATLPAAEARRFALDLALTGIGAAALSAPQLVAFADYLGSAEVGGHGGAGFEVTWLDPAQTIQYLVPYVYGTIFGSPAAGVSDLWASSGGYIGLVPVVLAAAALLVPRRRAAKLVLLGWIVVALGATQGLPGVHAAFRALPLMSIVAYTRYLNIGWIFCVVFLAALALDDLAALPPRRRRAVLATATFGGSVVVLLALWAAWPTLLDLSTTSGYGRGAFALAAASTGGLFLALAAITVAGSGSTPILLSGLMVFEAAAWFAVPYLSYPRHGHIDRDLVAFLQSHAGFQRVMTFETAGLYPNYGSAIGVALLDYDDLPSPRLTADYIAAELDPYATRLALRPASWGLTPEQRLDRRNRIHARLAAYGRAGVAFVMTGSGFARVPPYEIDPARASTPARLGPGDAVTLTGHVAEGLALPVGAVTVALRDGEAASGALEVRLCAGADCAAGRVDLAAQVGDDARSITLDHEVAMPPGGAYTLTIARPDGAGSVALPLYASAASDGDVPMGSVVARRTSGPLPDGVAPDVGFVDAALAPAYTARATQVYRLRDVRDYLSAPGCQLTPSSRDRLSASCAGPSRLTRLELAMRGWSATVDGGKVPIDTAEGAFQAIALPAGRSEVAFAYAPRGFAWALSAAVLALAAVAAAGGAATAAQIGGRRRTGRGTKAGSGPSPGDAATEAARETTP